MTLPDKLDQVDWSKEENFMQAVNSSKVIRQLSSDAIDEVILSYEAYLNRLTPQYLWRVSRAYNGRMNVSATIRRP